MFANILCAVDFSEASAHAIEYAVALAGAEGAGITALHVADTRVAPADVAALFHGAPRVTAVVDRGQPAPEILKRAASLGSDVIVMGTHGAGGFEHLMLGSVAEKVLRKATCPVLTVPPSIASAFEASFDRLVCAVDFSDWSLAALDEACAIAAESHGVVTAVHAIEWPWAGGAVAGTEGIPPEQASALCEYRRYLESSARARLDAAVRDVCGDRCQVEARVTNGKPYEQILCAAERRRADLIVLGVHGRNRLDVFFFGSTTHQVVRRATCPVLTLRH